MKNTTILIVDDHTLVREAWRIILSTHPHFQVVGEAGSADEGLALAESLQPDVVIMDINLPGMNGIEATKIIKEKIPAIKILGVSLHTQPSYAAKMMQEGASGYVTKNSSREEMFTAITEVLKGNRYVCKEIKNILSEQMLNEEQEAAGFNGLTLREMEVISLIKQGCSSKEIAITLGLSTKTVEVHRYNILKKLNLKNSAALVNFIHTHKLELA
ncbi:MAG TPA: response regulator transcription factor [Flavisolibacter sp.]|nr:response regulator transcription factor [Flavisolibacter sp.]